MFCKLKKKKHVAVFVQTSCGCDGFGASGCNKVDAVTSMNTRSYD